MTTSREDIIKRELINYQPTPEDRLVIKAAMFNFITLSTLGAASLGMAARYYAKSRPVANPRTFIPTLLGIFGGLVCGGALGMDKGMHKLRDTLPADSQLLSIIRSNDELKKKDKVLFDSRDTN
ncbi:hypothetical protein BDB01DRAFT_769698 [Pilobolus umbonatus]|nr:hypothetical protein BDB01DRAFT_769698 [Pilobolus umbonatus]